MRKSAPAPFTSEAALCTSFTEAASAQGWTVYPETAGYDLMLVKGGVQIGVEAKLRPSLGVLVQVARHLGLCGDFAFVRERGPHFIACLVPSGTGEFCAIAQALGALVFSHREGRHSWREIDEAIQLRPPLHFEEPAWLPPVVPTNPAGVPSPVSLTAWKWSALRLLARLEIRGYVTIADFREIGLHPSRWYHMWLVPQGNGEKPVRWVRKPGKILADAQHPDAFATALEQERTSLDVRTKEASR